MSPSLYSSPPRPRGSHATFGSRTDIGCVRDHNEDSLAVMPPLFVVADGMGGHAAGEVASEIAVTVIAEQAPEHPDSELLGKAVEEANLAIIAAAKEGKGREGMGTTCTAAMLEGERLVIAQVGDSRAYLLHQGKLQQLTRDHSLVADLVEAGQITPEEARVHPQRSAITRALGSDPYMQPDLYDINVEAGDRLLLCSDGLSSMLRDSEIQDILCRTNDPQRCAAQLVNAAIGAGGYDNVTVIVVNIPGLTEQKTRRIARKTKVLAVFLVLLLIAVIGSAGYAFNYWIDNSAYLIDEDGYVAIYRGVQGTFLGMSFSELEEVTKVEVDKLQPGLANRLRTEGVTVEGVTAAKALAASYQHEIDEYEQSLDGDNDDNTSIGDSSQNTAQRSAQSSGQGART